MGDCKGEVVDLFCGIGGLSHGFKRVGYTVVAGYDLDQRCRFAFETNNAATFYPRDVASTPVDEILGHYSGKKPTILAGCAPCQPFSKYSNSRKNDPRWNLVPVFGRVAACVQADFVTMENVPALLHYKRGEILRQLVDVLESSGYVVEYQIVNSTNFGVPQRRNRLVLLASRVGKLARMTPTSADALTVRDTIGHLPQIQAGEVDRYDALHRSLNLTDINLKRIRASKPGGTWRDWPTHLRAHCHRRPTGKTYASVYSRMEWDRPAPTITTQCYGFGNGRFGHPEQDRAISLREAALLQSFPREYRFLPSYESLSVSEIGRWIGNAVPVRLAEVIGLTITKSFEDQL